MAQDFVRLCVRVATTFLPVLIWASPASAVDPLASNNGLYPPAGVWDGSYRNLNYDYPESASGNWLQSAPRQPLTIGTAPDYVTKLKNYLEPSMRGMIEDPNAMGSRRQ